MTDNRNDECEEDEYEWNYEINRNTTFLGKLAEEIWE